MDKMRHYFAMFQTAVPQESGWDRWTPVQRTLFIDVKTGHPNKKYDGKVFRNGYTLIIQNLSKTDVNVSYSCLYGVTLGERKLLLAEDVFAYPKTSTPNGDSRFSEIEIAALFVGVLVSVTVVIAMVWFRIKRSNNVSNAGTADDRLPLLVQEEYSDLGEKMLKMETEQNEVIPKNIRDQMQIEIKDWTEKDLMFVSTRASDYVIEQLQVNSCLTLTAPSGVGKSFIARHTALLLQKEEYTVIPVRKPYDIMDYYQPGKKTVFLVDDICGNYNTNQHQIEYWQHMLPVINAIIADKCCKIIVCCRLQVYKDEKFDKLIPFKSCECNLMSDKLCLTSEEKDIMASVYIDSSLNNIDKLSQTNSEFFPLLCSLYHWEKHGNVMEFFKNPFFVYQHELDILSRHGVEGKYKICSLALLVLFNNQLKDNWIQGTVTRDQRLLIEASSDACGLNRNTSKAKLKEALQTLEGTFVRYHDGIYRTVNRKLFDFLVHYFGQKMIECLINHGDSDLVHERFIWRQSPDEKSSNIDFIIEIPDDYFELYLERFIKDWSTGKVTVAFNNKNMKVPLFRQPLLKHLIQLNKSGQMNLANTNDTVIPSEYSGSGNTPLILTCCSGYTDMVQWMLYNDVDVNQCRDDGTTGLIMASSHGHTGIVQLLLEKNPNVDLCDKDGCSPLYMASKDGHTDIVKLLLTKNPNVDLCDKDGLSASKMASQNGHTDIVKLLSRKSYSS